MPKHIQTICSLRNTDVQISAHFWGLTNKTLLKSAKINYIPKCGNLTQEKGQLSLEGQASVVSIRLVSSYIGRPIPPLFLISVAIII